DRFPEPFAFQRSAAWASNGGEFRSAATSATASFRPYCSLAPCPSHVTRPLESADLHDFSIELQPGVRDGPLGTRMERPRLEVASQGDKTAIELFLAGIPGWEAGLRRILSGKSGSYSSS